MSAEYEVQVREPFAWRRVPVESFQFTVGKSYGYPIGLEVNGQRVTGLWRVLRDGQVMATVGDGA